MSKRGSGSGFGKQNKAIRGIEDRIRNNPTESVACVDKDGNVLFDQSDGKAQSVSLTPQMLAQAKGNMLTHNHPHGYMFSKEDVDVLLMSEARGVRATTPDGRAFVLERINGKAVDYSFASAYKAEQTRTTSGIVSKYWNMSASKAENVHTCSLEHTKVMNEWLKANAPKYGFTFREEKRR